MDIHSRVGGIGDVHAGASLAVRNRPQPLAARNSTI
jgi:hypothetical protein